MLVFGFQFLGAATVIPREPPNIREEILHMSEQLPLGFLREVWEFSGLMIFPEFDDGDCRDVVEVENAVDLDPLQSDEVVMGAEDGGEIVPYVFGDKVVLVFCEG